MTVIDYKDAAESLLNVAKKIDTVLATGGWCIDTRTDEQMCLCSIRTVNSEYSQDEFSTVLDTLNSVESDTYYTISVHDHYEITLFYDLDEIVLFIQPTADDCTEWSGLYDCTESVVRRGLNTIQDS